MESMSEYINADEGACKPQSNDFRIRARNGYTLENPTIEGNTIWVDVEEEVEPIFATPCPKEMPVSDIEICRYKHE
jgi:hypothetical protein